MLQNQLTLGSIFFHVAFVMIPDAPQSGAITVVTLELLVLMLLSLSSIFKPELWKKVALVKSIAIQGGLISYEALSQF